MVFYFTIFRLHKLLKIRLVSSINLSIFSTSFFSHRLPRHSILNPRPVENHIKTISSLSSSSQSVSRSRWDGVRYIVRTSYSYAFFIDWFICFLFYLSFLNIDMLTLPLNHYLTHSLRTNSLYHTITHSLIHLLSHAFTFLNPSSYQKQ